MTVEPENGSGNGSGAPAPLYVRYNSKVQQFRLVIILLVGGLCLFIPFVAKEPGPETWRFTLLLIGGALVWGLWTLRKVLDRTPQVVVDENGVYFRDWTVGAVSWTDINSIAHSSSIRRGMIATITRTRRKPYLLFVFFATPKVRPTLPPPLSWLQFLRAEFAIQEPVIEQYGLDTPMETVLEEIQKQINYWLETHPEEAQPPEPPTT